MKIKLSDFILEQSVSDAEVADIVIEQAMSEIEVCTALLEAYIKEFAMLEYMMPNEDVITEADAQPQAPAPAEGSASKGVGESAKNAGNALAGFFGALFGVICGFFRWVGNKIGAIGDAITKKGKDLKQTVANATEEKFNKFAQYFTASQKRDPAIMYAMYNPNNVKSFINNMKLEIKKFGDATKKFVKKSTHGFRLVEDVKRDDGGLFGLGSNASNLEEYSKACQEFSQSVKANNPENKREENGVMNTADFKNMVMRYIDYYCSKQCSEDIRYISSEAKSVERELHNFDRHYSVTHKSTVKGDYGGGLLGFLKKLNDIGPAGNVSNRSRLPEFQRLKSVTQTALYTVGGGAKNSVISIIDRMDRNLKALGMLGQTEFSQIKDDGDTKYVNKMNAG